MPRRADPSLTRTNWDLILDAASDSKTARSSLAQVTDRSWPAVYAFIRASGRTPDEASDLTQGFLADVFLGRHLLEKADRRRGRFRTLLLGSVRNYLADMHRRRTARARCPEGGVVTLDSEQAHGRQPRDASEPSPERAFHARWVAEHIRAASERLQSELLAEGDWASWEIFRLRVLQAAIAADPPGYDEIGPRVGLDRGTCAARLLTTKRRFARILMDEMRATIDDPAELKAEIDDLRRLLEGP